METKCSTHKPNAATKNSHFYAAIASSVSGDQIESYKPVYVRSENKLFG